VEDASSAGALLFVSELEAVSLPHPENKESISINARMIADIRFMFFPPSWIMPEFFTWVSSQFILSHPYL
jgi:hypothetical protein